MPQYNMRFFNSIENTHVFGILVVQSFFITVHSGDTDISDTVVSRFPREVVVTSWNDMPFSGITMKNGTWSGTGYAFYLLELLSHKLNFTYTIVPPPEHVLGDAETGVLSMLYEKKVDMVVAFLPVLPEMRQFCKFSAALDEATLTALMKRPQESATGSGLLAPFDRTVWLLVLASLLFVGPVIYVFALIRAKLWCNPESENYGLPSYIWFVYSSLLKQGTNIIATTDSTRMLFATWWIFILILTSFYTANLTAFLTKPQFTLSINSLEDIVNGGYSWITYKGRTVDFLLSQPNRNELSVLKTSKSGRKGQFPFSQPSSNILNIVTTRNLFLADAHYLQTLIFEDYLNKTRQQLDHGSRCTYVIMPGSILVSSRAFGFPHNSSIAGQINKELLRLVETGIIQHRKDKDLPLAEICPVDLRSTERQLRNADLLLTYKVVGVGYLIATLIFVLELVVAVIIHRVKRRRTMKFSNHVASLRGNDKPSSLERKSGFRMEWMEDPVLVAPGKKHYINGRNYYVVVGSDGDQRLIPIRTPSAFLFQYAA